MKKNIVLFLLLLLSVFSCKKPQEEGYCDVEYKTELHSAWAFLGGKPYPWGDFNDSCYNYNEMGLYLLFDMKKEVDYDDPPCEHGHVNDTVLETLEYIHIIDSSYLDSGVVADTVDSIMQLAVYYYDKYYPHYYYSNLLYNPTIKTMDLSAVNAGEIKVPCSCFYRINYTAKPLYLNCNHSYTIIYKEEGREKLVRNICVIYLKENPY